MRCFFTLLYGHSRFWLLLRCLPASSLITPITHKCSPSVCLFQFKKGKSSNLIFLFHLRCIFFFICNLWMYVRWVKWTLSNFKFFRGTTFVFFAFASYSLEYNKSLIQIVCVVFDVWNLAYWWTHAWKGAQKRRQFCLRERAIKLNWKLLDNGGTRWAKSVGSWETLIFHRFKITESFETINNVRLNRCELFKLQPIHPMPSEIVFEHLQWIEKFVSDLLF
jgi:hypothetical protein